jgi:hypothetical protein
MDRDVTIARLKLLLRRDVADLCRRHDRVWSEPIGQTLREIRKAKIRAVLFGGALRSLVLSRLRYGRLGRPRDLDIVIAGTNVGELADRFRSIVVRETRFGGLQLRRMNWHFDVWPLDRTWAFQRGGAKEARFEALPSTTFFNLEAVAIDVWAKPGHAREIYSGDDQFFDGIISRTLEINLEENPFPSLCVVRALVMAEVTGFAIGPRLARYLVVHGTTVFDADLEETQRRHYGQIRLDVRTMRDRLSRVASEYARDGRSAIALPRQEQLTLWPEIGDEPPALNVHVLVGDNRDHASSPFQPMQKE